MENLLRLLPFENLRMIRVHKYQRLSTFKSPSVYSFLTKNQIEDRDSVLEWGNIKENSMW